MRPAPPRQKNGKHKEIAKKNGCALKNRVVGLDGVDIFQMDDIIIAFHTGTKQMKSVGSIFPLWRNSHWSLGILWAAGFATKSFWCLWATGFQYL